MCINFLKHHPCREGGQKRSKCRKIWETCWKCVHFQHVHTQTHTHIYKYIYLLFFWSFCSSKEIVITMKNVHAFLDMRRYKNEAHKISSRKYPIIWRLVLPVLVPNTKCLFLLSTLNSFQRVLTISSCSSTWFNSSRGRWLSAHGKCQFVVDTNHYYCFTIYF